MKAVNLFLLALSLTAISTSASAARYKASNYIYFDANGSPIGQTATYCNGVQWSGGNTTSSIFLKITTGCGATEFCPPEDHQCHVGVDNTLSVIWQATRPSHDKKHAPSSAPSRVNRWRQNSYGTTDGRP